MYKVYVSGFAGNLGTKILIEKKSSDLSLHFTKEYLHSISEVLDWTMKDGVIPSLSMFGKSVVDKEKIDKGGILTALWKICDRNHFGLTYDLKKIPILQGIIEITNFFNLNPYRLLTTNSYLAIIDIYENNTNIEKDLNNCLDKGLSHIGDIISSKKRVRIDGEREAFLTKDYKDEIDRILVKYTNKIFAKNDLI